MSSATGAVYDRGYRPYDGPRGGRGSSRAALWRLSVRRALGLRRSWRQKVFPWSLLAIATVPAVVNVGVSYLTRNTPAEAVEFITYRDYVGVSTTLLLFVALTAPDILCPDRRNRVLPLLFARPLTGVDYVAAKVGAIFTIVFGFSFLPHVVLFVGQMLVVREGALAYLRANAEVLWQVPVSVALFSLYWAALGCALASVTTRRVVGGVALLGLVLVTSSVAGVLTVAQSAARGAGGIDGAYTGLIDILQVPLYVRDLVFLGHTDPIGMLGGVAGGGALAVLLYLGVVGVSIAFLLRRYREVE